MTCSHDEMLARCDSVLEEFEGLTSTPCHDSGTAIDQGGCIRCDKPVSVGDDWCPTCLETLRSDEVQEPEMRNTFSPDHGIRLGVRTDDSGLIRSIASHFQEYANRAIREMEFSSVPAPVTTTPFASILRQRAEEDLRQFREDYSMETALRATLPLDLLVERPTSLRGMQVGNTGMRVPYESESVEEMGYTTENVTTRIKQMGFIT